MKDIPYELIARYLAGECTDNEKKQAEAWSREHPGLMEEFSGIWQQVPANEFNPDVEQALRTVHHRMDPKKKNYSKWALTLLSSAAAVILILSIIGIRSWNAARDHTNMPTMLALQTDSNQTLEYVLPDGSKVWLNRSSTISYPEVFANDVREISLEGEAFFEITPDANKPFVIRANQTMTRVVGTSFGIRAVKGMDEVVVTVSTGVINLSAEGKADHIMLKQGEQGICHPEQQKLEKNTDPDPNALAWKTKQLVFRQTSLTQVAQVLGNTYHTSVTVDSSIAELQLTSTFDQLSLAEILQIIEMTLQIQAKTSENNVLLTR